MGKYFGTDGVRGVANKSLTPEVAFKLGRISGYIFSKDGKKPKVLIGLDTRVSGPMFEGALIAGLLSIGAEVMRLGVISTPGVAYLTKVTNAEMGMMISASHNPYEDNGIKIFGPNGFKLTDEQEAEMEKLMDMEDTLPRPVGKDIGVVNNYFEGSQKYLSYLQETVDNDFTDIHVGLDCANGATSSLAAHLFADLEAEIYTIGNNPNGTNINDGVGSNHTEKLQALVKEKELDIGLAFDGDGDRLIAVDEKGNVVNGDQIMFICASYLHEKNQLHKDTVVATVMSNLGFYKALERSGIQAVTADVGDRYVMEKMLEDGYNFGGEQSGHVIFLNNSTSGDGMLTAIQLVNIMKETGKKLSELAGKMTVYPQVLKNITVNNKERVLRNPKILDEIDRVKAELGQSGRVLVRPSGTEPLIRVMVEAETEADCEKYVNQLIDIIDRLA
ncbi:phosphoglucosamine mutase [Pseudogracilibacillus auburnensis]|uniref:Phosphoglucosamine mutase n=1 Tax=Pseudogracilibacillus auburnensis TaxID=1494959 RepID=A0A2V3VVH9_9BACI|nr:phosphoglucosamine mutase [Pseudogracilibacillus auburnensis]MBO1004044.1 phosphoglucosamine mutase [Pseudogracilibacillus auburnensis]PXW85666.1 phosphoglucosamine mutase [Pseudogracilibacillus auburnensis]